MKWILFLIFMSSAHAYTLNNNFGASFKSRKVKVFVTSSTVCDQAGITVYELVDLIGPAIKDFWNTVPTSSLELKNGGILDVGSDTSYNTHLLCSYTDSTCTGSVIPAVNDIVIACNNNVNNFDSSNILAVTIPNNFRGRHINGSVILINNRNNSAFARLDRKKQISVIAHEIGHAIGLGHSADSAALMYFETIGTRNFLGQDDIDGVSALYPVTFDGCGLFKGSIDNMKGPLPPKGKGPSEENFWTLTSLGFIASVALSKLLKRFRKRA
jgi:hypothetical protein